MERSSEKNSPHNIISQSSAKNHEAIQRSTILKFTI